MLICATVILLAVTGLSIHAAAVGTNAEQWVATWSATLHQPSPGPVPAALAPAKPGDYFDARFDPEEDAIVFRRLGGREAGWVMRECPVSLDDVPPRRRSPAKRRKW